MINHTFVIPVYQESDYIAECIRSLKRQSIPSQIILTSAQDSEFIRNLADKYNLPVFINNNGGGIGRDWNFALNSTDSDLITIAHQDDIYLKNYTKKILDAHYKNPDSAIYHTDYKEIRNNLVVPDNLNLKIKKLLLWPAKISSSRWAQEFSFRFGCAICCPSVTYNMKKFKDYRFDEELKSNLDWLEWVKLHQNEEQFTYLPETLMLHRIHQESETSKQINENSRQAEDLRVLKEIWPNPIANLIEIFYKYSEKSNDQ